MKWNHTTESDAWEIGWWEREGTLKEQRVREARAWLVSQRALREASFGVSRVSELRFDHRRRLRFCLYSTPQSDPFLDPGALF